MRFLFVLMKNLKSIKSVSDLFAWFISFLTFMTFSNISIMQHTLDFYLCNNALPSGPLSFCPVSLDYEFNPLFSMSSAQYSAMLEKSVWSKQAYADSISFFSSSYFTSSSLFLYWIAFLPFLVVKMPLVTCWESWFWCSCGEGGFEWSERASTTFTPRCGWPCLSSKLRLQVAKWAC